MANMVTLIRTIIIERNYGSVTYINIHTFTMSNIVKKNGVTISCNVQEHDDIYWNMMT